MCDELTEYYDYIMIIFEVLEMYTFFVDLVKRSVLTLVGEIWRYRNDHYYYYYYTRHIVLSHMRMHASTPMCHVLQWWSLLLVVTDDSCQLETRKMSE